MVYLITGFIVGFVLSLSTCRKETRVGKIVRDTVERVTVRDSLVYRDTVIYETDTIWDTKIVYRDAPVNLGEDSTKVYDGVEEVEEGLMMNFRASVTGRLNWIKFGYVDKRPEMMRIVERERTVTEKEYIAPQGVYVVGGITNYEVERLNFGLQYLKNRWFVQYSTTPKSDGYWGHDVKVGFKIF